MARKREEPNPYEGRMEHPDYPLALGAIYIMPDEDLMNAIDELACRRHDAQGPIGYYLAELGRREQARTNRLMVRLTWLIAALTLVAAISAVASTAAVLLHL
jgi:hypothetical protein